ncbi:hypothetical protein [Pseudanabaena sp. UWO310]|uniref:hypothetical protein n=1 Tax=Pseudanabaena sp. UWO310 TaxID=2480795 RepID=UPI0011600D6B|nr:hypothetical protein [Pseudanabaena sp. UWO310]TYQ25046.1 hypothetical protein PseudUWO310_19775 [Pseudanabaena sp. UWO310]
MKFKPAIKHSVILATCILSLASLFTPVANAAQPSTDPKKPTLLTSGEYSGSLVSSKTPTKYYLTFLAGPGKITIDTTISPKDNKGAVFSWVLSKPSQIEQSYCSDSLYFATQHTSNCSFGTDKQQSFVLTVSAYANAEPVQINYKLKISGDWKPLNQGFVPIIPIKVIKVIPLLPQ